MSLKPSKKNLSGKRPAASAASNDKATGPPLASPAEDTPDRPRKSFFSFKASSKRSTSRPAVNHERPDNSAAIQFPSAGEQRTPSALPSANPPYKLEIPVRNLRTSMLFSQQFDLKKLGNPDEPLHRDPSPTPLLSDTSSRPTRSSTRPASWMMLNDGTYAPPAKAQIQSRSKSNQHSPETFYNGSRVPNRFESSDEDSPPHGSAAGWNRLAAMPQPQQSAKLMGVLAGYQMQPTPAPVAAAQAAPGRLQPPISILAQSDPRPAVLPSSSRPAVPPLNPSRLAGRAPSPSRSAGPPASPSRSAGPPTSPSRSAVSPTSPQSTYSPLAAFLGHAKSKVPVVLNNPSVSPAAQNVSKPPPSSSLLSAFLGSQSTAEEKSQLSDEQPAAPPITRPSPKPSTSHPNALSSEGTSLAPLNVQSAELSPISAPTRASEQSSLAKRSANEVASEPQTKSLPSGSPVGKPELPIPKTPEATYASSEPSPPEHVQAAKLETTIPLDTPDTPASSSSWPTPSYSSSMRSESVLDSPQPSTTRTSPMVADSALQPAPVKPPRSAKRAGSRKRSVEKVYLDSCSQHSSSSSDNYSSVGDLGAAKDRNRKGSSDLSGAVTDPSSACSHSSSPSARKSEEHKRRNREESVSGQKGLSQDAVDEEVEVEDETTRLPKINFQQLVCHPDIFRKIIVHLDYLDFFSLSQMSHEFQEELEDDPRLREIILKRYLSAYGYRSLSLQFKIGHGQRELVTIGLKDLANFYAGLEFESLELIGFAKQALKPRGLDYRTAKMIRSSTRAHNKLVAYVRAVEELDPVPATYRHVGRWDEPVYRPGKAALFKVWVPCVDHWMSNEELAECERELWRSQIWSYLKKGDVCWNLANGDFGNEGKLLFDGRFLRDLLFEFDDVGHLPSWLNMLDFPPSYFHKIISSSTSSPIFYLDLSSFKEEVKRTLQLSQDKIEVVSPQARYHVQRWVYRSVIKIPRGQWQGHVVIEVDGTSEHAKDLLRRCCVGNDGSKKATPWRIIREKSRPGKLWIRPVNQEERKA
ncbi:hypothetical protein, variant [Puccinia triticina 1-1 BBBD Race 1]|uniref:F-box domain-containing protein n=1 Tax=Puccinia triticina (isolate 1-1 / race 1 (BBBD)) TaxID=630390 RepID=A0A180GZ92_PUCT1|nr:hypothetical protein PTTG_07297 [Puccinia triticina 1-1 BBBD Race 1]OAV97845.1 hypothetical protein, variant [Puccinia triticina 1-1 BBBD Race 1]